MSPIEHDFIHRCVRTIRNDTGEVVHERTMTATEAQLGLDMPRIGKGATAKPGV